MASCLRSGNCCTSFGVCVTPFDLIRLAKTTKMEPIQLVQLIPDPPDRERTEPGVLIDNEKKLVVLRWKKDRICMFYSGVICNVYNQRPILCRTYPFCLKNGQLSEVQSRACPSPWLPIGSEKERYISDLKQYENDVENYRQIVEKWNAAGGGSFSNFLKYAIEEASKKLK